MISKSLYKKLLIVVYAFYILLALFWFLANYFMGGIVNYIAFISLAVFCTQAYYKHRVANLAFGIIILPASIFSALYFLSWGYKAGFDGFIYTMSFISLFSIVLSIFLVFSYLKLSFDKD
ncbi:MAG: bestrophin family protein [Taibaiella sp.]|nr:bestrophin family protein [Taibaiella sp.]